MQTPNAPRRQVRRSDGLVPWRASCPECAFEGSVDRSSRSSRSVPFSFTSHTRSKNEMQRGETVGRCSCLLATQFSTRTLRFMRRLVHRPRRLRRSPALRNLVCETHLTIHDFVLPLFVSEKLNRRWPVASMPGVFQLPVKEVVDEARRAQDLGLQAILLFGIPA